MPLESGFRAMVRKVSLGVSLLLLIVWSPNLAHAQCGAGSIAIADGWTGRVMVLTPSSPGSGQIFNVGISPRWVTTALGRLFVLDDFDGNLFELDCLTGQSVLLRNFADEFGFGPHDMAVDPSTALLYIGTADGSITQYDFLNDQGVRFGVTAPTWSLAIDADGCLVTAAGWLSASGRRAEVARNPTPGRCPLSSKIVWAEYPDIQNPADIDVNRTTGDLYLADWEDTNGGNYTIKRIPIGGGAGGAAETIVEGEWPIYDGVSLNQDSGVLYAAAFFDNATYGVVEVLLPSGATIPLSTPAQLFDSRYLVALGPQCGNGILEEGEQCDDGNRYAGDCCSACHYEPALSSCDNGSFCDGVEVCDGAGFCGSFGEPITCDDANSCTEDSCDEQNDECVNAIVEDGISCEDGSLCTIDESCQAGQCTPGDARKCPIGDPCTWTRCEADVGCIGTPGPAPSTAVIEGAASTLLIKKGKKDAQDQVKWVLGKVGDTTFPALGDPTVALGTEYGLCLWQNAQLLGNGRRGGEAFYSSLVRAEEGDCGAKGTGQCWKSAPRTSPNQFTYSDAGSRPGVGAGENGAQQLIVKSGPSPKGKIQFAAKGEHLPDIPPTNGVTQFELPVVAQLCNSRGSCWQSVFDQSSSGGVAPKKNVPGHFQMVLK